jgi:AcrR family transcriptional regulator
MVSKNARGARTNPRGRPPKFGDDRILDAALEVFSRDGPRGVTMAAVARELGAPSGSLYYRFASRDHLLAELWLRTVELFQSALIGQVAGGEAVETITNAAVWVVRWCRAHPHEGRLLQLYRREDLVDGPFPSSLAKRARAAGAQLETLPSRIRALDWQGAAPDTLTLRFVLADIPIAAVRTSLAKGEPIAAAVDELVRRAVLGVLRPRAGC